jgi:hypothetical protein
MKRLKGKLDCLSQYYEIVATSVSNANVTEISVA